METAMWRGVGPAGKLLGHLAQPLQLLWKCYLSGNSGLPALVCRHPNQVVHGHSSTRLPAENMLSLMQDFSRFFCLFWVFLLLLVLALPFGLSTHLTLGHILENDPLQPTLRRIGTGIRECECVHK